MYNQRRLLVKRIYELENYWKFGQNTSSGFVSANGINTHISVPCERSSHRNILTVQCLLSLGKLGGPSASLAHPSVSPKAWWEWTAAAAAIITGSVSSGEVLQGTASDHFSGRYNRALCPLKQGARPHCPAHPDTCTNGCEHARLVFSRRKKK